MGSASETIYLLYVKRENEKKKFEVISLNVEMIPVGWEKIIHDGKATGVGNIVVKWQVKEGRFLCGWAYDCCRAGAWQLNRIWLRSVWILPGCQGYSMTLTC